MDGNEEELLKEEGYAVMGAAFEVYNHLGLGFLEEVYQEAVEIEMTSRGISFVSNGHAVSSEFLLISLH